MKWTFAFLLIALAINANCQNNEVYYKLNQIAFFLNKNIPILIDSATRVDTVMVLPKDTLLYKCTLLGRDTANPGLAKVSLEQKMLAGLKSSPNIKGYSDYNISLEYDYYNEEKLFLFSFFITPDKYKN